MWWKEVQRELFPPSPSQPGWFCHHVSPHRTPCIHLLQHSMWRYLHQNFQKLSEEPPQAEWECQTPNRTCADRILPLWRQMSSDRPTHQLMNWQWEIEERGKYNLYNADRATQRVTESRTEVARLWTWSHSLPTGLVSILSCLWGSLGLSCFWTSRFPFPLRNYRKEEQVNLLCTGPPCLFALEFQPAADPLQITNQPKQMRVTGDPGHPCWTITNTLVEGVV